MTSAERTTAAERLASSKPSAQALLASLRSGAVKRDEVGLPALERMHTLLPGDPQMEELWRAVAAKFRRVLRLSGGNDDYVDAKLTLAGPFTVEAWVKLAPGINNHDGILGAPGSADFNFFGSQFRHQSKHVVHTYVTDLGGLCRYLLGTSCENDQRQDQKGFFHGLFFMVRRSG